MVQVLIDPTLFDHLQTWSHDGATVASALFQDGRIYYPGRWDVENHIGDVDPYTLGHEARVVVGLGPKAEAAIRLLSREVTRRHAEEDGTLELLWLSHESAGPLLGASLDRLVAALVAVHELTVGIWWDQEAAVAAEVLVAEMTNAGFPPTRESMEELMDGAEPACVGLGLVEL